MNKLSCIKNALLSVMVTSAFGVSAADLTVALGKGQQITLVKQGNQYSAKNINKVKSLGHFSKAFLSPSGEAVYLIWDGQKVDILNFGTYKNLWPSSADEAAFIDFLKSSKQTEFLAMLAIWKAEFLQNWWELQDWNNFVAYNLWLWSADSSMQPILEKTSALVYFLANKWDTLSYYDDFDEAVLTYKEADGFMEMITDLAEIAQDKAEIAQDKAEIAQDKAEIAQLAISIAESEKNIAQDKTEMAQLDKSIAQNKKSIAQNIAVINAYKKVMWAL